VIWPWQTERQLRRTLAELDKVLEERRVALALNRAASRHLRTAVDRLTGDDDDDE
jgi:hypothetical protein